MRNYKPKLSTIVGEEADNDDADEHGNINSKKYLEIKAQGVNFYSAMNLLFLTGSFRLLPTVAFPYEVILGYNLELFLMIIPMLFCQGFNNSDGAGRLSTL